MNIRNYFHPGMVMSQRHHHSPNANCPCHPTIEILNGFEVDDKGRDQMDKPIQTTVINHKDYVVPTHTPEVLKYAYVQMTVGRNGLPVTMPDTVQVMGSWRILGRIPVMS